MAKLEEEEGRKWIDSTATLKSHIIRWCMMLDGDDLQGSTYSDSHPLPRAWGTVFLQLWWFCEKGAQGRDSSETFLRQTKRKRYKRAGRNCLWTLQSLPSIWIWAIEASGAVVQCGRVSLNLLELQVVCKNPGSESMHGATNGCLHF